MHRYKVEIELRYVNTASGKSARWLVTRYISKHGITRWEANPLQPTEYHTWEMAALAVRHYLLEGF